MSMRLSLPELVRLAYRLGYCIDRYEQRYMEPAALHRSLVRDSMRGGAWPRGMNLVERLSKDNFDELVGYILDHPPARLHGGIRGEIRSRLLNHNYSKRLIALVEEKTR